MIVNANELDGGPHDAFYTHNGLPFTGTAVEHMDGVKVWEASFKDGINHGWDKSWFADGVPQDEANFIKGKPHGKARAWHKNGRLLYECEFVEGVAIKKTRWDENGNLIPRE